MTNCDLGNAGTVLIDSLVLRHAPPLGAPLFHHLPQARGQCGNCGPARKPGWRCQQATAGTPLAEPHDDVIS